MPKQIYIDRLKELTDDELMSANTLASILMVFDEISVDVEQETLKQILALPTHPAGYAKERMISPKDIEKLLI